MSVIMEVRMDAAKTRELLAELNRRLSDLSPVMDGIGQILVSNTQDRFDREVDPFGNAWAPLKASTLARRRKGTGIGGHKILRDTGRLYSSIAARLNGATVSVGTNVSYGRYHQTGTRRMVARPFIGYSDQDAQDILALLEAYLEASKPPSWWQRLLARFRRP